MVNLIEQKKKKDRETYKLAIIHNLQCVSLIYAQDLVFLEKKAMYIYHLSTLNQLDQRFSGSI